MSNNIIPANKILRSSDEGPFIPAPPGRNLRRNDFFAPDPYAVDPVVSIRTEAHDQAGLLAWRRWRKKPSQSWQKLQWPYRLLKCDGTIILRGIGHIYALTSQWRDRMGFSPISLSRLRRIPNVHGVTLKALIPHVKPAYSINTPNTIASAGRIAGCTIRRHLPSLECVATHKSA